MFLAFCRSTNATTPRQTFSHRRRAAHAAGRPTRAARDRARARAQNLPARRGGSRAARDTWLPPLCRAAGGKGAFGGDIPAARRHRERAVPRDQHRFRAHTCSARRHRHQSPRAARSRGGARGGPRRPRRLGAALGSQRGGHGTHAMSDRLGRRGNCVGRLPVAGYARHRCNDATRRRDAWLSYLNGRPAGAHPSGSTEAAQRMDVRGGRGGEARAREGGVPRQEHQQGPREACQAGARAVGGCQGLGSVDAARSLRALHAWCGG